MRQRKATSLLLGALCFSTPMVALAAKPCDELKAEIAAKIDAAGAKDYALEVVKSDADAGTGKVVGTCDAGKGKIVYRRGAAGPAAAASAAK